MTFLHEQRSPHESMRVLKLASIVDFLGYQNICIHFIRFEVHKSARVARSNAILVLFDCGSHGRRTGTTHPPSTEEHRGEGYRAMVFIHFSSVSLHKGTTL